MSSDPLPADVESAFVALGRALERDMKAQGFAYQTFHHAFGFLCAALGIVYGQRAVKFSCERIAYDRLCSCDAFVETTVNSY